MRATRRAKPALARLLLLVAVLVGAQLTQLSHFLLVPHEFCEHGDLVHALVGAEPAAVGVDDGETRARVGSSRSTEHEHCDANAIRAQVPGVVALPALFATLTFIVDAVDREGDGHSAIDVLDLAPKVSPPRA